MEFRIIKSEDLKENDFKSVLVTDILNTEEYEKFSIAKVKVIGIQKSGINEESDIAYYVLEGEGRFIIEDEIYDVKKGDLIFIPKGVKYKDTAGLTLLAISAPRFDRNKRKRFDE